MRSNRPRRLQLLVVRSEQQVGRPERAGVAGLVRGAAEHGDLGAEGGGDLHPEVPEAA
jgi:hypothetical protein